jgi:hypothetical protein
MINEKLPNRRLQRVPIRLVSDLVIPSLLGTVWNHLRADMPSVPPFWPRLRTPVRALASRSSSSTSQLREKYSLEFHDA